MARPELVRARPTVCIEHVPYVHKLTRNAGLSYYEDLVSHYEASYTRTSPPRDDVGATASHTPAGGTVPCMTDFTWLFPVQGYLAYKKAHPLGPYRMPVPRALEWVLGESVFSYGRGEPVGSVFMAWGFRG